MACAPGAATKLLKVRTVPGPLLVGAVYIMCPSVVDQYGITGRGPQSVQSVPLVQPLDSAPGPPSSHEPSEE